MDSKNELPAHQSHNLLDIPVELTEAIANHLSLDDFSNFRLTSRKLREKSFDLFIKRYFTRRVVKLQPHNLRRLIEIAAHPPFKGQIRCLEISPEPWSFQDESHLESVKEKWNDYYSKRRDDFDKEKYEHMQKALEILLSKFSEESKRNNSFETSRLVAALLTRAFMGLGSLESLRYGLIETTSPNWDYETQEYWHAAGLFEAMGCNLSSYDWKKKRSSWEFNGHRRIDDVFSAISASGITMSRLMIESGSFMALRDPRPQLDGYEALALQSCLRDLKSLHISLNIGGPSGGFKQAIEDVTRFFKALPDTLEQLELRTHILEDMMISTTRCLKRAVRIWCQILEQLKFPRLHTLDVEIAMDMAASLLNFIENHRDSLRTVRVSHARIAGWVDDRGDRLKWSAFLELFLSLPNLEELYLATNSAIYCDIFDFDNDTCQEKLGTDGARSRIKQQLRSWREVERYKGLTQLVTRQEEDA
ncbi:hypothetical protein HDK90DRAFT_7144 [Phyllosticta capitalensis]|uniref:F-box domain-containing protein n=1 Tax=Phyllosticta capitalensis TaxID=121624 RepID=A0ABR1Z283_9PEZI